MTEAMPNRLSHREAGALAHVAATGAGLPQVQTVPLIKNAHGSYVMWALVPGGVELKAQGMSVPSSGQAALDQLNSLLGKASTDAALLASARSFWESLPDGQPLHAQLLTVAPGPGQVPGFALEINASTPGNDGAQAVVIDARALLPGSSIHVRNLEFVAVVGDVRLTGGQGPIVVVGDGTDQTMVLGMDDPMVTGGGAVHGGGGNDTVGGLRGSQQIFGGDGNDIVFGGGGNDFLSGGAGNDRLNGGLGWDIARQSGFRSDYTLSLDGDVLMLTHKTTGEVDRFKSIELIKFDRDGGNVHSESQSSLYVANNDAQAALAHITSSWLGRDPMADEAGWIQQNGHLTDVQVAEAMLKGPSAEALQRLNLSPQQLVANWQENSQIVRLPDLIRPASLGRYDQNWADIVLEYDGPDYWTGTSLIDGDMAEFKAVERLHLKDVSVALDVGREGKAGKLKALMSVTLGAESLADKSLVGQGLTALDAGMGLAAVGEVAMRYVQKQQGRAFTEQEIVQWLWTRATYREGTPDELRPYVQQLQSGKVTTGDLVNAAIEHQLQFGTPITEEVKPLLYTL